MCKELTLITSDDLRKGTIGLEAPDAVIEGRRLSRWESQRHPGESALDWLGLVAIGAVGLGHLGVGNAWQRSPRLSRGY